MADREDMPKARLSKPHLERSTNTDDLISFKSDGSRLLTDMTIPGKVLSSLEALEYLENRRDSSAIDWMIDRAHVHVLLKTKARVPHAWHALLRYAPPPPHTFKSLEGGCSPIRL